MIKLDNSHVSYWARTPNRSSTRLIVVVGLECLFKNVYRVKQDIDNLYMKLFSSIQNASSYYIKSSLTLMDTFKKKTKNVSKTEKLLSSLNSMNKVIVNLKAELEKTSKYSPQNKEAISKINSLISNAHSKITLINQELNSLLLKSDNLYYNIIECLRNVDNI